MAETLPTAEAFAMSLVDSGPPWLHLFRIPGYGFGLAIVSEIAQLHGATMQPGSGEVAGVRVRTQFRQASETHAQR